MVLYALDATNHLKGGGSQAYQPDTGDKGVLKLWNPR